MRPVCSQITVSHEVHRVVLMSSWKQLPVEATAWIRTERYMALLALLDSNRTSRKSQPVAVTRNGRNPASLDQQQRSLLLSFVMCL